MARIRELLTQLETSRTEMLERMEQLQTRLDQSPGHQQVNKLQSEMEELRQKLEATETEMTTAKAQLETLRQTLPPPRSADAIPEPAPAPIARPGDPPPPPPKSRKKEWF